MNTTLGRSFGLVATTILLSSFEHGCLVSPDRTSGILGRSARPAPASPEGVVRLVEWCWEHRDLDHYTQVFTDDYRFVFPSADSSGNAFPEHVLRREDELEAAHHLFETGTSELPPARRIRVDLERDLLALPDSRPGRNATWHRVVRSRARLAVETGDRSYRASDALRFFLVRGDSALIPPELAAQGFVPDTGRWYLERWEEENSDPGLATSGGPWRPASFATQPTEIVTWGQLKVLYRGAGAQTARGGAATR